MLSINSKHINNQIITWIFFVIFVLMSYDNSGQTKINCYDPVWSPAEDRIAFYSNVDGDYEVYVMDMSGMNLNQITKNNVTDGSPSWSPDGLQLTFKSDRNGNSDLYLYDFESRQTEQMTFIEGQVGSSSWSPNGQHIAFECNWYGRRDIYLMSSDGSKLQNLTKHDSSDFRPSWSADGNQIFFQSKRTGIYQIHTMDENGMNVKQIYKTHTHQASPSQLGKNKLVYASHDKSSVDIHVLNLENLTLKKVSSGLGDIMMPSFSKDGSSITFAMTEDGISNIYVMNNETKEIRKLTGSIVDLIAK